MRLLVSSLVVLLLAAAGGRAGAAPERAASCLIFTPCSLAVSITSGSGHVTGPNIDCPTDCTGEGYVSKTGTIVVKLAATPAFGFQLGAWSGCDAGTSCQVTMSTNRSVSVSFTPIGPQTLDVSVDGEGTVTASGISCPGDCSQPYAFNTSVQLTASPKAGWSFQSWGGDCAGSSTTCTVTMTQARSVSAKFVRITHTLTVARAGTGGGKVTSSPAGLDCGSICNHVFNEGTSVTLTATPDDTSAFAGWGGACSGTAATCTLTISADKSVTANFRPILNRLTVTRTGNGTVTSAPAGISCGGSCAADFLKNTPVTLTEAPGSDSFFAGWGGACAGETATCTVTLDAVKTVTATFKAPTISLDAAAFAARWRKSQATGTLTISGKTSDGADVQLTISSAPAAAPVPLSLPPGAFKQVVPLPAGLLPGRYFVQLAAVSHGVTLAPQQKTAILAAPPEGVVSDVVVSAVEGGPPIEKVAPGAKEIYARFHFASRPQPKCVTKKVKRKRRRVCTPRAITVAWFSPAGKPAAPPLKKPYTQTMSTFVRSNLPLDPGTWRVELRVGGVLVMDAQAIVPAP